MKLTVNDRVISMSSWKQEIINVILQFAPCSFVYLMPYLREQIFCTSKIILKQMNLLIQRWVWYICCLKGFFINKFYQFFQNYCSPLLDLIPSFGKYVCQFLYGQLTSVLWRSWVCEESTELENCEVLSSRKWMKMIIHYVEIIFHLTGDWIKCKTCTGKCIIWRSWGLDQKPRLFC